MGIESLNNQTPAVEKSNEEKKGEIMGEIKKEKDALEYCKGQLQEAIDLSRKHTESAENPDTTVEGRDVSEAQGFYNFKQGEYSEMAKNYSGARNQLETKVFAQMSKIENLEKKLKELN